MLPFLTDSYPVLAQARQTLLRDRGDAHNLTAHVPQELRNNAGLLFARVRWARRRDMDRQAAAWLREQPFKDGKHDSAWWQERHIIIRRLLDRGQNAEAYQLAADHRLAEAGLSKSQAEFMAGWIALRRLRQPRKALPHFARLYKDSHFPISKARGAYWLGRTYGQAGDTKQAARWASVAGQYPATFYGQLALAQNKAPWPVREQPVSKVARGKIERQDLVRIALQLHQIGEDRRFGQFLYAQAYSAKQRDEFIVLTELARRGGKPDVAVRIAKLATQRNVMVGQTGYPAPNYKIPNTPGKALTLSLIRQESMFDAGAVSPSGARGLMQLMPATARETARKQGMRRFSNDHLFQPAVNLALGCRYLDDLLKQFDGSVVMAVAAYNAGPGRVRQWQALYGDPRGQIDVIDWIETIPVYETRNYVQRVIEGLQIYRAALGGRAAGLKITKDLQGHSKE